MLAAVSYTHLDVYKRQGPKRIPSREGGVEVVVEELCTRMVNKGHKVTYYNRGGHHVSGKEFDSAKIKNYKGINQMCIRDRNRCR